MVNIIEDSSSPSGYSTSDNGRIIHLLKGELPFKFVIGGFHEWARAYAIETNDPDWFK